VTLPNQFGCDSLVITATSFDPTAVAVTQLSALNCDAAAVGVDTVLLTSAAGCDSLVITTTALAPTSVTFLTALSCNPNAVGTDTVTLANQFGCDSLVITATSFDPTAGAVTQLSALNCDAAAVGVDTVLLTSAAGCDSLVITTTSLAPFSETFLTALSCNPNQVGTDTVTLVNQFGCDSLVITSVAFAGLEFEASAQGELCFGGNDGQIRLENVLTAYLPVEVELENHPVRIYDGTPLVWQNLAPGIYALTAVNAEGCALTLEVGVAAADALHLDLGQQPVPLHSGDSVWVEPTADFPIAAAEWSPAEGVACAGCPATFFASRQTTTYTLTAFDPNGCSSTASLRVLVDPTARVYVPNAVRPGSGGLNGELAVFAGPEVERIRSFQLFDRWGNLIFEQPDLAPNQPCGWDGTFRGKAVEPGVLIWVCKVEVRDGRVEDWSGDVTVLR
jgi:hypothetical protein